MAKDVTKEAAPVTGALIGGEVLGLRVVDNPPGYVEVEVRSASLYIDEPNRAAPTVTHRFTLLKAEAAAFALGAQVTVAITGDA